MTMRRDQHTHTDIHLHVQSCPVHRVCFRARVQLSPSETDRTRVTVQLQVSQRLTCSTRLCQRRIDEHLREVLNEPLAEWDV